MTKKIFVLLLFSLGLLCTSYAQQDPLYSQYMFNMVGINPAYAGSREILSVTAMTRAQWVGVKGSPVSAVLVGDFATRSKKVGIGIQLFNDKIGITATNGLIGTYAYRLRFRKGVFAMGIQGGVSQFRGNYTAVQLSDGSYDAAFANNVSMLRPTFGAGIYYNTDKFYAGFSSPHLLHYSSLNGKDKDGATSMYQNNHWFLTTGYVFDLTHDIKLKPSLLLRLVSGAPVTVDINANIWFYNTIGIGLSGRTSNMYVGMVEIQATKQFRFGYAFDFTASALKRSSHEVMLRYEFGYEKRGIISPRHF